MIRGHLQYPIRNEMTAGVLGFSLRFPESKTPTAFWDNLMNQIDMLTTDDHRWPRGLLSTPPRVGKAPGLEMFDNAFFSIHGKQAQKMDPQLRKLLEVESLQKSVERNPSGGCFGVLYTVGHA